jgi:hypothetical protein
MILNELFERQEKTVAVTFGRLNPPTIGHQKLVDAVLKQKADAHFLFVSQTQKTTGKNQTRLSNPIPFDVKLGFIQQAFPNIDIGDTSVTTAIGMLQYLEKQGFENVIFVGGSDRVADFDALFNKQNGIDYNLKSIKVVSSGARDPDAEGAEGMSASKMRAAAIANDLKSFKSGLPAGLQGDAESVFAAVRQGLEPWLEQKEVEEGWDDVKKFGKKAAVAGAIGLGALGAHAQGSGEDFLPDIVAHVTFKVNEKEITKDINLGSGFKSPGEASEALAKFLKSKGIKYYDYSLERVKPKDDNYLDKTPYAGSDNGSNYMDTTPAVGNKSKSDYMSKENYTKQVKEAPIEMDPADPMDPMIHNHDKANPAKLKYRMLRAAGQLKDLAARAENASPSEWQLMARQFEELKMNMEQIRHALEELGKLRKKGGIRSRGIDPMLDHIMDEHKKDRRAIKHSIKPRNPVAHAAQTVAKGSGPHKDKKKAAKQGDVKHKNQSILDV